MDTPDVMAARAALDAAPEPNAAPDTTLVTNALLAEIEKQALALAKQEAPAVVAAAEAALPMPKKSWKRHLVSITEQTVSTFAFTFLGLISATNLSDPTALKAAGVAGVIAVAAYLKTVAARYVNNSPFSAGS